MFSRCIIETDNQKTTCLERREPLNMFKIFFATFGLFLFFTASAAAASSVAAADAAGAAGAAHAATAAAASETEAALQYLKVTGIRTQDSATTDRCATNELNSPNKLDSQTTRQTINRISKKLDNQTNHKQNIQKKLITRQPDKP